MKTLKFPKWLYMLGCIMFGMIIKKYFDFSVASLFITFIGVFFFLSIPIKNKTKEENKNGNK